MSKAWEKGSDTRWRAFRSARLGHWVLQGRTECEVRGPKCTGRVEQVDHIVPLELGGEKYAIDNVRPACEPCNTGRRVAVQEEPPPITVSRW